MADWRKIKSRTWRDKKIVRMTREARLLFIGWITLADDEGCLEADPETLKAELYPGDNDVDVGQIQAWSDELVSIDPDAPIAERWICGAKIVVRLPNFEENQKIRKDRKKDSKLLELIDKGERDNRRLSTDNQRLTDDGLDKTRLEQTDRKTSASPPSATVENSSDSGDKPKSKSRTGKQAENDEVLDAVLSAWKGEKKTDLRISVAQILATYCRRLNREPSAVVRVVLTRSRTNPEAFAVRFGKKLELPPELENGPKLDAWQTRQAKLNQKRGPTPIGDVLSRM